MKRLNLRIRAAGGWAIALGLALAAACGSETGKGSGVVASAGTGGGGGSGGAACLTVPCVPGQFTIVTQIMDQCLVECGESSSGDGQTEQADFDGGEFFIETSSAADAGAPLDGGSSSVAYALIRLPDEGPLGGHWLCAAGGSVSEATQSGTAQTYSLDQLSDLGPCEGDAANTETLTITASGGSTPTVTGTIDGEQVANSSETPSCSVDRCEFQMPPQAGQTAGYIAVRTETDLTPGESAAVSEAAWVAPRHLGYHLICAGEGSTITRGSEAATNASLVGLRKKTCPGTPLAGTIQGKLSTDPSTSGGS